MSYSWPFPEDSANSPELTVVLATADGGRLDLSLAALDAACAGLRARILIVSAGESGDPETIDATVRSRGRGRETGVDVIRCPAGSLVPRLWGAGLRAARAEGPRATSGEPRRTATGEAIAFTSTACAVAPGWAHALLATLRAGADGTGGPFELASGASAVDSAMFYLRYSRFLEGGHSGRQRGDEIAGDNAAYRLAALDRYDAADGFWEVVFHKSLRAEGGTLAWCPAAVARFSSHMTFTQALVQRFVHGRHSGAWRVVGGRPRWKVLLAAPLVPVVMARRAFACVASLPGHRFRFLGALPVFLLLAGAWALGEAAGGLGRVKDE